MRIRRQTVRPYDGMTPHEAQHASFSPLSRRQVGLAVAAARKITKSDHIPTTDSCLTSELAIRAPRTAWSSDGRCRAGTSDLLLVSSGQRSLGVAPGSQDGLIVRSR